MADAVDQMAEQWRTERPDLAGRLESVELLARISRMQRVFDQHYKKLYEEFGLNLGEIDMLFTLRRSGPPYTLSAGAFVKAVMVTAGAITNRLDRMEAKGLVERVRESTDRRSVQIRLTEHGKALADEVLAAHMRNYEKICAPLDPQERKHLNSELRRLLEAHGDTTLG
ncbi:MarR family winged helix-turn-helix transcriptional regulator [Streptomyces roseoverticillatus]|uniref:MarR family winged helix-turn-helix transcriptional regulator n=1 Tax=Streptomyces roseoverticillatus TaxID=66429 RepID=UPI0004C00F44|nr:MarR family transcriptional regulator [Streptomyces roseoverticillatus]